MEQEQDPVQKASVAIDESLLFVNEDIGDAEGSQKSNSGSTRAPTTSADSMENVNLKFGQQDSMDVETKFDEILATIKRLSAEMAECDDEEHRLELHRRTQRLTKKLVG